MSLSRTQNRLVLYLLPLSILDMRVLTCVVRPYSICFFLARTSRRQAERVTLVLIVVLGVQRWFKTLVPEHPNESEQSSYA